jgi:hypothetical protein
MKKLLVLILNNYLVGTLIQSPIWCDIWNQVETLLTSLNQTLPPIIKYSLTLLAHITIQVNEVLRQYLVRPLIIYLVFTVVKITYHVCWKTGYYNYNPVFIKQKGLLFRVYNACEEVTYWIIRDSVTQHPSAKYIIHSFCIIFAVKALNFPLTLLILIYIWWIYGGSNLWYLITYETKYWRIKKRLENKKLTFQRWETIYNGGKLSPGAEKFLFDIRTSNKIGGHVAPFYRAGWKGSGRPHYTNTDLKGKGGWDPSFTKGHSLSHSSNVVKGGKVANTVHDLLLETAKKPGFYTPSKEILWVDPGKVIYVNSFDLYVSFYTFYQDSNELHTLLYSKWTFPAVTELKYQNDLNYNRLENLIIEEGVDKNTLFEDFTQTIKKSPYE